MKKLNFKDLTALVDALDCRISTFNLTTSINEDQESDRVNDILYLSALKSTLVKELNKYNEK